MAYELVSQFGKDVLDYLLSISNDGDTILFAIDENIYRNEIFHNDNKKIQEFEKEIREFVKYNKLDFLGIDNYALALAAHQIKIAYGDDEDEKRINKRLLDFYFQDTNINIYKYYYDPEKSENTLQDKLWLRISSILKENNRILINIHGQLREQKYIKSQLIILKHLKMQFYKIMYSAGLSRQICYTRNEFENKLDSKIIEDTIRIVSVQIQKEVDSTFNFDKNILFGQLWLLYNQWDGEYPKNSIISLSDSYVNDCQIYLNEEYIDDDSDEIKEFSVLYKDSAEEGTKLSRNNTELDRNKGIYYRIFFKWDEFSWKMAAINTDIPLRTPFLLLVENDLINLFSCDEQNKFDITNNINYKILKYNDKPLDLFDNLPKNNVTYVLNYNKELIGGVRIANKEYLDIEDVYPILKTSEKYQEKKIPIKLNNQTIFENIKIIGSNNKELINYKLIPVVEKEVELENNINFLWGNILFPLGIGYLCRERNVLLRENNKDNNSEDVLTTFRFQWNVKQNTRCIPYNELFIQNVNKKFEKINVSKVINAEIKKKLNDGIIIGTKLEKGVTSIEFSIIKCYYSDDYKIKSNSIKIIKCKDEIIDLGKIRIIKHADREQRLVEMGKKVSKEKNPIRETTAIFESKVVTDNQYNVVEVIYDSDYKKSIHKVAYGTELFKFQNALYQWIGHLGIVTWQQIRHVCSSMIQSSNYYEDLCDYPEYKIFMPLFKIGIVEPCENNYGEKGFCLCIRLHLLNDTNEKYFYRNHFYAEKTPEKEDYNSYALTSLKRLPPLNEIIKDNKDLFINSEKQISDEQVYYKFCDWNCYGKKLLPKANNLDQNKGSCIFKKFTEEYTFDYLYFADNNSTYQLNRDNPDSLAIAYSYINTKRIQKKIGNRKLFTYYPKDKILVCNYVRDTPAIYLRTIMLNNPNKFLDDDIYLSYCPEHYKQVFTNVEEEFVKELDRKYK